jgi:A/G-specific adenine glycosylase
VSLHGSKVPLSYEALISLPGVGPYVASAVLAVTTGSDVVLTDTNTVRVALRVIGEEPNGDVRRNARTQAAIYELLGGAASAADWWSVLDLAAAKCTVRTPVCTECPLRDSCRTGQKASTLE